MQLKKLNIIIFGVDRCPDLCRPALEEFLLQLGRELDIYIGIISIEKDHTLRTRQHASLSIWLSYIKSTYPDWHIKACETFQQTEPGLHGSPGLLEQALKHCQNKLDVFYDGYTSIRNYMNYLYFSHCFSSQLMSSVGDHLTLLIRPDMQYGGVDRSSLAESESKEKSGQRKAYVLGHDSFGYVNDRFIASSPQNVIAYMQRINLLERYLRWPWRYFHSEQYASWYLRKHMKLQINELPLSIWGRRIRATGPVIKDSNPSNYEADRKRFRHMFLKHSYWQIKLSLKKRLLNANPNKIKLY